MRRTYSAMARFSLPVRSSFSAFFRTSARSIGTNPYPRASPLGLPNTRSRAPARAVRHSTFGIQSDVYSGLLNPIKQRRGPDRAAVRVRVAVARHRVEVLARRVALVPVESIARIQAMELEHGPVPRHLGHNRRRRNRGAARVAVHDAALRHRE